MPHQTHQPSPFLLPASLQKRGVWAKRGWRSSGVGAAVPACWVEEPVQCQWPIPARPSNLGRVLLCSGGLSHITVLHVALHLTQLLPDLEQGDWVCVEAWLDTRSSPGGPQAFLAAPRP